MIAPATPPPSLDDFFRAVRTLNPFTDNRVTGVGPDEVDVPEVHAAVFDRLTSLAQEASGRRSGLGALLWGEAGIGKSHILARLARWADEGPRARLVSLHNLQAGPEVLPRSLLRTVISILTRGRQRDFLSTPLCRLVAGFAHEAAGYPRGATSWPTVRSTYERHLDRLGADPAQAALIDRTVYDVLLALLQSAWHEARGEEDGVASLAVRWLAGDYLDPHEGHKLGLPGGPVRQGPVALRDNQQVKQVLVALARMALSRHQPFILCFDQVDNLDREQMGALSRFLEALLDAAPNLLVVTAGIQATLLSWRDQKVIQDSAWDRLAQFELRLQRVSGAEAERIVAARLERFFEPFRGLEELRERRQADPLFPLGAVWRAEHLNGKTDLRPRDVLTRAREAWGRVQETIRERGGAAWLANGRAEPPPPPQPIRERSEDEVRAAIEARVAQAVAEHQQRRVAEPHTLPWDADHLAGLTVGLLERWRTAEPKCGIVRAERMTVPKGGRPAYDVSVRLRIAGGDVTAGLLFLATGNATAAAGFLRRLVQTVRGPRRLLLVTDARAPLSLGPKGQEYLRQLRRKAAGQFRHVELPFADYALLDALQAVVGQAGSGDLEIDLPGGIARRITEDEALAALVRTGRYRTAPVLRELVPTAERGTS